MILCLTDSRIDSSGRSRSVKIGSSPSLRGMRWICTWGTTCPATFPSFTSTLIPSTPSLRFRSRDTSEAAMKREDRVSWSSSVKSSTWFLGTTNVWPSANGLMSRKLKVRALLWIRNADAFPSSIRQKGHEGSCWRSMFHTPDIWRFIDIKKAWAVLPSSSGIVDLAVLFALN